MRKLTWTIGIAAVTAAFPLAAAEGRDPRAPYDQLEVDRALPQFPNGVGDRSRYENP